MKRTRISLIITAAAALTLFLGSCAEGPVGIFASVAAETDINRLATKEFRGTSPSFVAKLGGTYYAGIGGLWKRGVAETKWTKVNANLIGLGTGNYAAISGFNIGATMYALFVDADTKAKLGVYKSTNGSDWTEVPAGLLTKSELSHIMTDGTDVFAVTAKVTETDGDKSTTHSIYTSNGTLAFTATGIALSPIGLPTSVILHGGFYYLSAGNQMVRGNNFAALAPVTQDAPTALSSAFLANGSVFFTGRNGRIYEWNGTAWIASAEFEDYNDRPYSFSIPVVVTPPSGPSTLLVPSRAYPQGTVRDQGLGYLEFDAASFSTGSAAIADKARRVSTLNNYFITLDGKSVKQILAFEEGGARRLFALTDGDGLWSNFFDGGTPGSWSGWRRE